MGDGGGFGEKYWVNVAGAGYSVRFSHAVGAVIWDQEFGGDKGHAKSTRGIISSGSQTYCVDGGVSYYERRLGLTLGVLCTREHRGLTNQGIYTAEAGNHCIAEGLHAHI